jgi:hypothetical protein
MRMKTFPFAACLSSTPDDQGTRQVSPEGKLVNIWHGSWQIAVAAWNTDQLVAVPEASLQEFTQE